MISAFKLVFVLVVVSFSSTAKQCEQYSYSDRIITESLWTDFSFLASDHMQGRKTQTQGAQLARNYLQQRFAQIGLSSFAAHSHFFSSFAYLTGGSRVEGTNVVGYLKGSRFPNRYLVVTAHYDHLGKQGTKIYNGADDNASGVAALLSLATALSIDPPRHSVIFVATDAEEKGLYGAKAFVHTPPVDIAHIKANINLDMLSQHRGRNRLYVTGARYYPQYQTVVKKAIAEAGLCLVAGHRSLQQGGLGSRRQKWRQASDHAAFAKVGIPYLFIGVTEHGYYHSQHDTVDKIRREFYYAAVDTSLTILRLVDDLP